MVMFALHGEVVLRSKGSVEVVTSLEYAERAEVDASSSL